MDLLAQDAAADRATMDRYRRYLSAGRAALGEMFGGDIEVASEGAWVRTSTGRRLLNCGGYGVLITGARHPRVVAAVREQLDTNPVATRLLLEPTVGRAAEALVATAPDGLDRVHFACGGAEAVEAAIKLARANGKRRLISMDNGYHGKTLGALSVTAKPVFQDPFHPLLPGVAHVPFGDAAALAAELAAHPGEACVIVEPVQAEAGVIIPPAGYLAEVARLCRAHGAFLVLDEIQTGLGRLGYWWGAERERVTPDVLLAGKALGGGVLPVSAAIAGAAAFAPFDRDPFIHTSTFSGSPLGMAAAHAAITAIREEDLVWRARWLGELLTEEIDEIVREALGDAVREVRGLGMLIGIELAVDGLAGELLLELVAAGVIANHSLNSANVLRLTPPAVLAHEDVDFLLAAVETAARAVADVL
ncbi:MAG TPA: aminotransferase class III-fold pyridoxal phosphate-dependent enzyme [Actinophytocola sp.]|uniref:aspartate aminotransferase family protein n=1 Tax=Actinophytocola sp. TaxID=1872138 RepID=UPI002DDCA50D|nr:aminotransferase class III-fold pyridoxal phosphate-dependent enzyme [Actinophytocola sp.]HEV2779913.1 aminotransferase class III-fold pyridoxal phosphate-dependent enzyme [Actinophytocola sp.]